ncbi:MAG TPA: hypothetical protein VIJ94_08380 [Caulobacteraceae bacterium]
MDFRTAIAVGALALLAAGTVDAAPGRAVAPFAGATLGMSLQDWRAAPFPDGPRPHVQAACSNDLGLGQTMALKPTLAERKAGAVVCGYVSRLGRYVLLQGVRPAAKRKPVQVRYVFLAGRLSEIRYRASRDAFDQVTAQLKAAYGPPRAIVRDKMRSTIGNLDRVRMTWAAPFGSAVLTDPADARLDLAVELSSRAP